MNDTGDTTSDAGSDVGARPLAAARPLVDLAQRAAVVVGVGAFVVLLILGAGYAIDVLLLAFAGLLFGILLSSLSRWLREHSPLGGKTSLAATVVLLVVLGGGGLWLLATPLSTQVEKLQQTLPQSVQQLRERVEQSPWGRWALSRAPDSQDLMSRGGNLFTRITRVVSGVMGAVGGAVVIFFVGLFFASQPRLYREGALKLVTPRKRARARDVLLQIGTTLEWWILGKLASMTIVGVLTWVGLMLLGIEMALALAVLAALLAFIPNFGPILSAVPAVLAGLLDGPMTGLWVIVLYVVVQTVESYLITPLIEQRTVSLPPALIITAQLAMGVFAGALGLALATPLTAAALVIVRTLYVQDILGDQANLEA